MPKIAFDAGHGGNGSTPGKRDPDGIYEWNYNNVVAQGFEARMKQYGNVSLLRLDDWTGKTDVPLITRTDKANAWGADLLISFHHNALSGVWHNGGGVETFTHPNSSTASKNFQKIIHPAIVQAMGLSDRGMKTADFHMLRESDMPAVLVEGGFMDSRVDIKVMRVDAKLREQGAKAADAVAKYFNLKLLDQPAPPKEGVIVEGTFRVHTGVFSTARQLADAIEKVKNDFGWTTYERAESTNFNPGYRIFTGVFTTLQSAESAQKQLNDKYGWLTYIKEY